MNLLQLFESRVSLDESAETVTVMGRSFAVLRNPTVAALLEASRRKSMRGLIEASTGDCYWWPASLAIHCSVAAKLGLSGDIFGPNGNAALQLKGKTLQVDSGWRTMIRSEPMLYMIEHGGISISYQRKAISFTQYCSILSGYPELTESSKTVSSDIADWVMGTKVVDAEGLPLLVYHGTSDPRFKKFSAKGGMGGAIGFWFASTNQAAEVFARQRFAGVKPGVKICVLKITNPIEYNGYGAFTEAVQKKMTGGSIEDGVRSLRRSLVRSGYDGLVIRDCDSDGGGLRDDWVAFDAKQIKEV